MLFNKMAMSDTLIDAKLEIQTKNSNFRKDIDMKSMRKLILNSYRTISIQKIKRHFVDKILVLPTDFKTIPTDFSSKLYTSLRASVKHLKILSKTKLHLNQETNRMKRIVFTCRKSKILDLNSSAIFVSNSRNFFQISKIAINKATKAFFMTQEFIDFKQTLNIVKLLKIRPINQLHLKSTLTKPGLNSEQNNDIMRKILKYLTEMKWLDSLALSPMKDFFVNLESFKSILSKLNNLNSLTLGTFGISQMFFLSNNPTSFGNWKKLVDLSIVVETKTFLILKKIAQECESLISLSISFKSMLENNFHQAKDVFHYLTNCTLLKNLYLRVQNAETYPEKSFVKEITSLKNHHFEKLSFDFNDAIHKFRGVLFSLSDFGNFLTTQNSLMYLSVSTLQKSSEIRSFFTSTVDCLPNLAYICLCLTTREKIVFGDEIILWANNKTKMVSFHLRFSVLGEIIYGMTDKSLKKLFKAITSIPSLKNLELNLPNVGSQEDDLDFSPEISKFLRKLSEIRELSLILNNFFTIKELTEIIESFAGLKECYKLEFKQTNANISSIDEISNKIRNLMSVNRTMNEFRL